MTLCRPLIRGVGVPFNDDDEEEEQQHSAGRCVIGDAGSCPSCPDERVQRADRQDLEHKTEQQDMQDRNCHWQRGYCTAGDDHTQLYLTADVEWIVSASQASWEHRVRA